MPVLLHGNDQPTRTEHNFFSFFSFDDFMCSCGLCEIKNKKMVLILKILSNFVIKFVCLFQEGYWGLQLGGCRRCACGPGASACDPDTGACACADGVGGAHCDTCLPGYYGFGSAGCLRKWGLTIKLMNADLVKDCGTSCKEFTTSALWLRVE